MEKKENKLPFVNAAVALLLSLSSLNFELPTQCFDLLLEDVDTAHRIHVACIKLMKTDLINLAQILHDRVGISDQIRQVHIREGEREGLAVGFEKFRLVLKKHYRDQPTLF